MSYCGRPIVSSPTASPTAAYDQDSTVKQREAYDENVQVQTLDRVELRDSRGRSLGQAFGPSVATKVVGAISLIPREENFTLALVSAPVPSNSTIKAYTLVS